MNKKIFKYIFFTFVILFGFYSDVKAVGYCEYSVHDAANGAGIEKILLYQGDSSSSVTIFATKNAQANPSLAGVSTGHWQLLDSSLFVNTDKLVWKTSCLYMNRRDCSQINITSKCPAGVDIKVTSKVLEKGLFGSTKKSEKTYITNFTDNASNSTDSKFFKLSSSSIGSVTNSPEIPEIYCMYKGGDLFQQKKDGTIIFYHNKNEKSIIRDTNWEKQNNHWAVTGTNTEYWTGYYFTKCPNRYQGDGVFSDSGTKNLVDEESGSGIANLPESNTANENTHFLLGDDVYNMACEKTSFSDKWLVNPKYKNTCLYSHTYNVGKNGVEDYRCDLIQISFDEDGRLDYYTSRQKFGVIKLSNDDVEVEKISEQYKGSITCPIRLYSKFDSGLGVWVDSEPEQHISLIGRTGYDSFSLVHHTGALTREYENLIDIKKDDLTDPKTCEELLSSEVIGYLKFAWNAFRIGIPLILIGLGIVDFARGVFSNEDEMKKIQKKFINRLVLALGFFLIPSILGLLLQIANEVFDLNTTFCGIFG